MIARRRASAKYRERNEDDLREKARVRMAKYRERAKQKPDLLQDMRARAREASRKYRAEHADALAHRARVRRMDTFEKKHGRQAWTDRWNKLEAQRREAQEAEEWKRHEEVYQRHEREREAAETLHSLGATRSRS